VQRIKLDRASLDIEKLFKKVFKHLVWIAFAVWTGYTFVDYFSPIRALMMEFLQTRLGPWESFWILFYGFATYGNAGWMREQVCKHMCPYARFQSVMFDSECDGKCNQRKISGPRHPPARAASPHLDIRRDPAPP
jgi:polyferredoxin